uniref:Microphthalmia-associated transcription factor n=1 Tax=Heterorhabditis bacteriophora TaxID=37862 RepID=A0A1I7XHC2_HETBA
MEPSQNLRSQNMQQQQQLLLQQPQHVQQTQRPSLRLDMMMEKGPPPTVAQTAKSGVIITKPSPSPLIFDQQIKMAGNKLVHLPPLAQTQTAQASSTF